MATTQRSPKKKPVFAFTPIQDEDAIKLLAVKRAKKSAWLDVVKQFIDFHEQNPETDTVELDMESHEAGSAASGLYNALRSARKRGDLNPVDVRQREIDGEKRVFLIYSTDSVNNTEYVEETEEEDEVSEDELETEEASA